MGGSNYFLFRCCRGVQEGGSKVESWRGDEERCSVRGKIFSVTTKEVLGGKK